MLKILFPKSNISSKAFSEEQAATLPNKLHNIQALRGISALLIVVYHIADFESLWRSEARFPLLSFFKSFGYFGVYIFFVLSGFIITYTSLFKFTKQNSLRSFYWKRFLRIYPIYWIALFGFVLITFLLIGKSFTLDLVKKLSFFDSVFLLPNSRNVFIPQAWTLCVEVFFYVVYGLIARYFNKQFNPILVFWTLTIVGFSILGFSSSNSFLRYLFHPMNLFFVAGCFMGQIQRNSLKSKPRKGLVIISLLILGWFSVFLNLTLPFSQSWAAVIKFLLPSSLLVYLFYNLDIGNFKMPRIFELFGDASYSIYLLHFHLCFLLNYFLKGLSYGFWGQTFWVIFMLLASLAAGVAFYYFLEVPFLNLVNKKKNKLAAEPS